MRKIFDRFLKKLVFAVGVVIKTLLMVQGFDSRAGQIGRRVADVAMFFLHDYVVSALSRGDGSRRSLHASVLCREYNEDLIFIFTVG